MNPTAQQNLLAKDFPKRLPRRFARQKTSTRGRRIALCALLGLLIGGVLAAALALAVLRPWVDPAANAVASPGPTLADYDQLTGGMSYAEVLGLLGNPDEEAEVVGLLGNVFGLLGNPDEEVAGFEIGLGDDISTLAMKHCLWRNGDAELHVVFGDGRLAAKARRGLR